MPRVCTIPFFLFASAWDFDDAGGVGLKKKEGMFYHEGERVFCLSDGKITFVLADEGESGEACQRISENCFNFCRIFWLKSKFEENKSTWDKSNFSEISLKVMIW